MLFDIAKKDFPNLEPDDVQVIKYGGIRYAKTYGIEFDADQSKITDEYYVKENLEFI